MLCMITYGRQNITQTDINEVVKVLQSDWLTQGPMVPKFEQSVAQKVGAQYAVAVNSATSALHIACLALDLGPGDWLWTSPNTFVASANCGLYCGAKVDFVDIDPKTYNMSLEALTLKLEAAARLGTLPKIVIPVHFAGQSCDMVGIHQLSQKYGFKIIEDASHAIGGKYKEQYIGNCKYSDITIFSFHPVKIITSGEGGMGLTNSATIAERMQQLRSHGITRQSDLLENKAMGAWYYEQQALGFNYRMTDIQAALGCSQLERLDQFVAERHRLAVRYDNALSEFPLVLPYQHYDNYAAFHLYVVQVDVTNCPAIDRGHFFKFLYQAGVGVNVHYIPVHIQPYYRQMGFHEGMFIESEHYYTNVVTLPLFYDLGDEQQDQVIDAISKVYQVC